MKSSHKRICDIQKAAVPNKGAAAFFYSSKKYKIPDFQTFSYDFSVRINKFSENFFKKISKPEATFQVFTVELAVGSNQAEVRA